MKPLALFILTLLLCGCPAFSQLQVAHVEFGVPVWNDSQRRAGVLFQDGSQSIPVEGGALWTFGDTFIGKPQPGQPPMNPQITGSVWATFAWLPAGKTNLPPTLEYVLDTNGVAACPLTLFPEEDHKHLRLWPTDGIGIGPEHAAAFEEMVLAQGLGDADRQAPRDEEGDRGAGTPP